MVGKSYNLLTTNKTSFLKRNKTGYSRVSCQILLSLKSITICLFYHRNFVPSVFSTTSNCSSLSSATTMFADLMKTLITRFLVYHASLWLPNTNFTRGQKKCLPQGKKVADIPVIFSYRKKTKGSKGLCR